MRAAIQQERRVEFNCEGISFHELRRWKIADKYLGGKLYGMNHDGSEMCIRDRNLAKDGGALLHIRR